MLDGGLRYFNEPTLRTHMPGLVVESRDRGSPPTITRKMAFRLQSRINDRPPTSVAFGIGQNGVTGLNLVCPLVDNPASSDSTHQLCSVPYSAYNSRCLYRLVRTTRHPVFHICKSVQPSDHGLWLHF